MRLLKAAAFVLLKDDIFRLQTENNLLRQALWDTQKELRKHKLLLADLANADRDTERMFADATRK